MTNPRYTIDPGRGKTGGLPARHLFFQDVKKLGGGFWPSHYSIIPSFHYSTIPIVSAAN
jgi:hypothetical protein